MRQSQQVGLQIHKLTARIRLLWQQSEGLGKNSNEKWIQKSFTKTGQDEQATITTTERERKQEKQAAIENANQQLREGTFITMATIEAAARRTA